MLIRKLSTDRHGLRLMPNIRPHLYLTNFSLPTTFKMLNREQERVYSAYSVHVRLDTEQGRLNKDQERPDKEQERLDKEQERLDKEQERLVKGQERLDKEQERLDKEQERLDKEPERLVKEQESVDTYI
jgi:hypothetical protein